MKVISDVKVEILLDDVSVQQIKSLNALQTLELLARQEVGLREFLNDAVSFGCDKNITVKSRIEED